MTLTLSLPVAHSPITNRHDVPIGYFCGVEIANDETPTRAALLRDGCSAAGAPLHEAVAHGIDPVARVHDRRFLDVMAGIHEWWIRDGSLQDPGNPYVTPYFFPPVAGVHGGSVDRRVATSRAEIGRYAMDTMTLIGAATWEAALAAADVALTASDFVLAGSSAAFAISRPPGHHAGPAFFGGSCYLNNAAAAAAHLRANGAARVAIIDIDAHHGNGTQAIFWNDPTVLFASIHVDPARGWFPHTVGWADEVDDSLTNLNVPIEPGSGDDVWLSALDRLIAAVGPFSPDALVVSLGLDAAAEDPNSPLEVTMAGYGGAGRRLADLATPTVLVLEGGYVEATLADLAIAVLEQF